VSAERDLRAFAVALAWMHAPKRRPATSEYNEGTWFVSTCPTCRPNEVKVWMEGDEIPICEIFWTATSSYKIIPVKQLDKWMRPPAPVKIMK
jgi:hypothetical protein